MIASSNFDEFAARIAAESDRTRIETGKGVRLPFTADWYKREVEKGAKLYIETGKTDSSRVGLMFSREDGIVYVTILYGPSDRHLLLCGAACQAIINEGWGKLPIRYRGAPSANQLPLLNLIALVCKAVPVDPRDPDLMEVSNAEDALALIQAAIRRLR